MMNVNENTKDLVWYVCYGSNMYLKRFMCYLTGEALPELGLGKDPRKYFHDQTKPRDTKNITIHYEMYFGRISPTWGGGVAFLKHKQDPNVSTIARAYLITKEQFEHVWDNEGRSAIWYGRKIELDPIDGIPAVTFSSEVEHEYNKPSDNYVQCITNGLIECGLDLETAQEYIKRHIRG